MMVSSSFLAAALWVSVALSQHVFPDCQSAPLSNNSVCDTTLSPADRAKALVAAMNLDEKFNLTGNTSPGVPRIGLPAYEWWQEALHGVAGSPGVNFSSSGDYSYASSFPEPITMGAAFDDALILAVATVVSTEARAFNNANRAGLDYWTPNINPYKDPRWGRGMETPGEDPFHLASYVKNLILGLQGGQDPTIKKVIATCKHFAAYDLENWNGIDRVHFNAIVSTQDLREYYLVPFQQCARDSNVGSIMCSYNEVNGVPSCADTYLLQTILREHWGWTAEQQYITSDCDAVDNIYSTHNYTSSPEQGVADALIAGTDIDCGSSYPQYLPSAYSQSLVNESTLDQALERLYGSLVYLGYFDPADATPYRSLSWSDVSTPKSEQLALQAATEGLVLLQNNGALPLAATNYSSVAVIGDWANATTQMQGNYYGNPPYLHSPLYAAQQVFSASNVQYGEGPTQSDSTGQDWPEATQAVDSADVVLYFGGIDTNTEAEGMDRYNITWSPAQIDFINSLSGSAAAAGKPFIISQMGDQLDHTPFLNNTNISAILWGGYPGQDGGTALINVITGKSAPAGRLPVTQYPADYVNEVDLTNMDLRPGTDNPGRTYKWYSDAVFEFGSGIHYTNFTPSLGSGGSNSTGLASTYDTSSLGKGCNETHKDLCPFATVPVSVQNTGNLTSDYVALLFVSGEYGPSPYPRKQLVAYNRLHDVQAGQVANATLPLTLGSISRIDEQGNQVVYPGSYALLLDVPTNAQYNFTVTGDPLTLDEWPQPSNSTRRA